MYAYVPSVPGYSRRLNVHRHSVVVDVYIAACVAARASRGPACAADPINSRGYFNYSVGASEAASISCPHESTAGYGCANSDVKLCSIIQIFSL